MSLKFSKWFNHLPPKSLHFFTGKGGVGKSTMATLFAQYSASMGRRTLLMEYVETPQLNSIFHHELGYLPWSPSKNLCVSSWNGKDCVDEYIAHSIKLKILQQLFDRSKALKALINTAPSLKEIAILGKLTSAQRSIGPDFDYDVIVFDAPATGHFVSLIEVPQALYNIASVGPMGTHTKNILEVLKSKICNFHIVASPEFLVIDEVLKLRSTIESTLNQESKIWLNMFMNIEVSEALKEKLKLHLWGQTLCNKLINQRKLVQIAEFVKIPHVMSLSKSIHQLSLEDLIL